MFLVFLVKTFSGVKSNILNFLYMLGILCSMVSDIEDEDCLEGLSFYHHVVIEISLELDPMSGINRKDKWPRQKTSILLMANVDLKCSKARENAGFTKLIQLELIILCV